MAGENKELHEALANGEGFENTEEGKRIGFNEKLIDLHAFNLKHTFVEDLIKLQTMIENEEFLYNNIKDDLEESKKTMADFIRKEKGISITSIKTSDLADSLELYKKRKEKRLYNSKHLYVKTFIDVMRGKKFNIVDRFSSDFDNLLGENLEARHHVSKDFERYIRENNLKLCDVLSIYPKTAEEAINHSMDRELNYHYANEAAKRNEIEEKLNQQTKIPFSKELSIHIEAFDFRIRKAKYEDFYKMMVGFAINDKNVLTQKNWATLDELKNYNEGELLFNERENEHEEDYIKTHHKVGRKIGEDVFIGEINTIEDCEGKNYSEKWYKNGVLHRLGDFPASKTYSHHKIPEETHLDKATEAFWLEGERLFSRDTTYDEILSKKSLAERQSIGYDVDDDIDTEDISNNEKFFERDEIDYIKKKIKKFKIKNGIESAPSNRKKRRP